MKVLNALILISALFFCAVSKASVAEPANAWKKKVIKVCWAAREDSMQADLPKLTKMLIEHSEYDSLSTPDRLRVKEVIQREYNFKTAGIKLIGWNDCTADDSSDVLLFSEDQTMNPKNKTDLMFVDSYHGCSSIGDDSNGSKSKRFVHIKKIPDDRLKISSLQALELIALHEFGHLLGLRHEHARRMDALMDPNCTSQGLNLLEVVGSSGKTFSSYDPNSIMNYCHDFSLMNKTGTDFYLDGLSEINLRMEPQQGFAFMQTKERFSPSDVNFIEGLVVTKTPVPAINSVHVQVKIGITEMDRHALKCLYDSQYRMGHCVK